ncbi:alpha/beta hydrolase [Rhizobium albus]|nr:alpha/beta hydrolase [Rhizobium albus]
MAMAPIDRMITTSDASLRVRDTGGDGLPIVLLHGSGSSIDVFHRQFADPILSHHRLVAIELPGHGLSSDAATPEKTYTLKGLAGVVTEVLTSIGVSRAVFFGWSLGGHVTLQIAATTSIPVALLLSGTPPVSLGPLGLLRGFQPSFDILLTSKRHFSERDVTRFAQLCFGDSFDPAFLTMIARTDGRLRVNFLRSLMHGHGADQRRLVETSQMPIALVNGVLDPFVRLSYLETIPFANLWRDRSHLIPATGHAAFWHAPQLFNPLLNAFVRDAELVLRAERLNLRRA